MSLNKWLYTYSNPINMIDPSGRDSYCEGPFASQDECVDDGFSRNTPDVRSYNEKTPPPGVTFIPGNTIGYIDGIPAGKNGAQIIDGEDGLCGPASVTWVLSNNITGITLQQVVGRYVDLLKSDKVPSIWKCDKAKGSAECICNKTDPADSKKCIEFARSYSPSWNGVGHLSQLFKIAQVFFCKFGQEVPLVS